MGHGLGSMRRCPACGHDHAVGTTCLACPTCSRDLDLTDIARQVFADDLAEVETVLLAATDESAGPDTRPHREADGDALKESSGPWLIRTPGFEDGDERSPR